MLKSERPFEAIATLEGVVIYYLDAEGNKTGETKLVQPETARKFAKGLLRKSHEVNELREEAEKNVEK